jgi:predicted PurR-regulated permease PerM
VAGNRGRHLLTVAYGTLKGVVYGIIGAAFAQASLAAFGYWLSGVPAPLLLGLATGFFGIVPGGPAIIWLPAAIWLFRSGEMGWAIFVALWSVILVGNIDNVIRPLFVSRRSTLPLLSHPHRHSRWRHGLRLHRHLSGADDPRDLVHVDERM